MRSEFALGAFYIASADAIPLPLSFFNLFILRASNILLGMGATLAVEFP